MKNARGEEMVMDTCQRCEGCGQIANSDEGEPWIYWKDLPPGSDLAVRTGIVKPIPCPDCGGSGEAVDPLMSDLMDHMALSLDEQDDIRRWFTYHPPTPEQIPLYENLRAEARTFALSITAACPAGIERDRALAALRETVMWANAGIACAP